jgi:hypothetical protein
MIFSIQHYLEDYFDQRNLSDVDQYAVKLANLYALRRKAETEADFLKAMRRLRTVFYRNNRKVDRGSVERDILLRLDRSFKKKLSNPVDLGFSLAIASERIKFRKRPRRTIAELLRAFKHAAEARGIDTLWDSRASARLRRRPEKLAQSMLSHFVMGVLSNGRGNLLRELSSGSGFVDLAVMFGCVPHLVEIKVLQHAFTGVEQLATYMATENRREGWLVIFDARQQDKRVQLQDKISVCSGTIHVLSIDINPIAPSRRNSAVLGRPALRPRRGERRNRRAL